MEGIWGKGAVDCLTVAQLLCNATAAKSHGRLLCRPSVGDKSEEANQHVDKGEFLGPNLKIGAAHTSVPIRDPV